MLMNINVFWKQSAQIYKGTVGDNLQNDVNNVTYAHFLVKLIGISVTTPVELMVIKMNLSYVILSC